MRTTKNWVYTCCRKVKKGRGEKGRGGPPTSSPSFFYNKFQLLVTLNFFLSKRDNGVANLTSTKRAGKLDPKVLRPIGWMDEQARYGVGDWQRAELVARWRKFDWSSSGWEVSLMTALSRKRCGSKTSPRSTTRATSVITENMDNNKKLGVEQYGGRTHHLDSSALFVHLSHLRLMHLPQARSNRTNLFGQVCASAIWI